VGIELSRDENGEFVLIKHWKSQEAADGWNAVLFQEEAGQTVEGLVDLSSMRQETLNMYFC